MCEICHIIHIRDVHPEQTALSDQAKPGGSDGMASAKLEGKQQPMVESPQEWHSNFSGSGVDLKKEISMWADHVHDAVKTLITARVGNLEAAKGLQVNMWQGPKLPECHINIPPEGSSSDQAKPGGSDGMASAKQQPMVESDPNWYSDLYTAAFHDGDFKKGLSILIKKGDDARTATMKAIYDAVGNSPKPIWNFVDRSEIADLEVKNADGCTPLEIADRVGNLEAEKVLVNMHPDSYDPKGSGQNLPRRIIKDESYDDAFALIERVPELGVSEKEPALTIWTFNTIAKNASAFTRGLQVKKLLKELCKKAAEKLPKPGGSDGMASAKQEVCKWFLCAMGWMQEVFTENHKNLMVEVEKRVKETANACILVAVLILGISYEASITVPGGISTDNGQPVLGLETAFKIFGVANAVSLFGACASMLTFLSILSSRYTNGDFLRALPRILVVGILSLYMSVASLMVSYTLTRYLMFGHRDDERWKIIGCAVVVTCFLSVEALASHVFDD